MHRERLLHKHKFYRVKVIDPKHRAFGHTVKAKWCLCYFQGKEKLNFLYLPQVEVLNEITPEEFNK